MNPGVFHLLQLFLSQWKGVPAARWPPKAATAPAAAHSHVRAPRQVRTAVVSQGRRPALPPDGELPGAPGGRALELYRALMEVRGRVGATRGRAAASQHIAPGHALRGTLAPRLHPREMRVVALGKEGRAGRERVGTGCVSDGAALRIVHPAAEGGAFCTREPGSRQEMPAL
jgi:hypothetical protein